MEEILASIRRIIADDDERHRPAAPPHLAVVEPVPDPAPVVAERSAPGEPANDTSVEAAEAGEGPVQPEEMRSAPEGAETSPVDDPPEGPEAYAGEDSPAVTENDPDPSTAKAAGPAAFSPEQASGQGSPAAAADLSERAFSPAAGIAATLAGAPAPEAWSAEARLLSPKADQAVEGAFNQLAATILSSQARTLEDLVKEMMRPMLRDWLDDNLPPLVERLVREEIERVSRGRR